MSSHTAAANTEAATLARLIQMGKEELPRGAVEHLLSIRFGERDTARMNELSELAQQGKLTAYDRPSSTASSRRQSHRDHAIQGAPCLGASSAMITCLESSAHPAGMATSQC